MVVVVAALVPVLALAAIFPEGGSEPFNPDQMRQILVISLIVLATLRRSQRTLAAGLALYALGCLASYRLATRRRQRGPTWGAGRRAAGGTAVVAASCIDASRRRRYTGRLTSGEYESWLHQLAVDFAAVADARLDWSSVAEVELIDQGPRYLRPVLRTPHWRVYAVENPTSLAQGAATITALDANSVTLLAHRAGRILMRIRYSPYWAVSGLPGCVRPAGQFTEIDTRRPGRLRLVIEFSPWRIGARSPRCA